MMLELKGVSAGYGGVNVIHAVDVAVDQGEIVTLVGNNGAGKSTLVKTISGLIRARSGTISFAGRRIEGLPTAARMRLGVVHVPEGRQIFSGFTIADNLELGGYLRAKTPNKSNAQRDEVGRLFPLLRDRMAALAGNLSGGQQQMLAIGRGLMSRPKLLMLDEPSLGLAPLVVSEIFDLIVKLRGQGLAILLSEQNARLSLAIADRGYVIENGRVALSGSGQDLLHSKDVADRYLGVGAALKDRSAERQRRLTEHLRELLRS